MQKILNETDKVKEIYENYQISQDKKELAKKFMDSTSRYIFGRNDHSKSICKKIKIDYVVDDFAPEGKTFEGAKVIKTEELPKDGVVVSCVFAIYAQDAIEKLKNNGIINIISYSDLCYLYSEIFDFPEFVLETRKDFLSNQKKWQEIFRSLEDEKSKKILNDILLYRLTGQNQFLSNYKVNLKKQYFADAEFLNLKEGEVFIDCGGFDGDTSEEFIKNCADYKKIYFFEPSSKNIEDAKKRLANKQNIEFIKKGVSDIEETLNFSSELGSACIIADDGNIKIEVVKIDDYVKEKYTLLKMDLEGWEMKALKGAENSIKKYLPKIAIAVYHSAKDFYEIFNYVKSFNPNYKVYIRHYTQGWSETVMFFIPSKDIK